LVLEQAPPADGTADGPPPQDVPLPWIVSGRSRTAVRAQARRLHRYLLDRPEASASDIGLSLAATRTHFPHRAAVIGRDRKELAGALEALARDRGSSSVVRGTAAGAGGTAFLFSGQGSQRPGMGAGLSEAFPVFAKALGEVCDHLDVHLDRPLRDLLFAAPDSPEAALLDRTRYTQPALFALETALYRLLTHWGVIPDRLIGHSVGELTAAHVAGVLDLPDAAALVAARARLMDTLPAGGAMIAVEAEEDEVRERLAGLAEPVDIAAVNGPRALVLSGEREATERVAGHFRELGRRIKPLRVSHAFHSPLMEPMLEEFRAVAGTLTYHPPSIPVVSNVTGRPAGAEELCSPDYWTRHIRAAVRFHDGLRRLSEDGVTTYLELGPDAVLTALAQLSLPAGQHVFAPVLLKDRPEAERLVDGVSRAWANGTEVDWDAVFPGARHIELPPHAFQRRHYWLPSAAARGTRRPDGAQAGFWDAVARQDLAGLAEFLGLEEERRSALSEVLPALSAWWLRTAPEPAAEQEELPGRTADAAKQRQLAESLAGSTVAEQELALLEIIRTHSAAVLGHAEPGAVAADARFMDLGFSSFTALDLRNRLCEDTGLLLRPVVVFDHPTPVSLARYLRTALGARNDQE
ncbi:acyltransferase domain-containing protein, partial [Streptomyces monomycini]